MKNTLILILLMIPFLGISNDFCRSKHSAPTGYRQYKSGDESLRSDTVNVINYDVYMDFTQVLSSNITANCKINFEALMDINSISFDLLELNVDSVIIHGNNAAYSYNDSLLIIQLPGTLNAGNPDSLTVYYSGTPPQDPSGWGGFYMSSGYYYNLGVGFESDPHNYGRVWHPCFDNFVERATYDFEILTNDQNTAYCNGTRLSETVVGTDSLLTTWKMNTEIPSYLAGISVSNYTHVELNYFSTSQGIDIPMWLVSLEADTTNFKLSFATLSDAMEVFEDKYGPYIWERVGFVAVPFNAGAMEHATHIAYPLAVLNGTTTYETLMAHELSHHWWGDWVTTETAEEMWINEGMASYSEFLFTEWMYGYDAYMDDIRDNHYDMLHRAHIDDSGHYALNAVPIKWTYGEHSYRKAADVIHSLRKYMGDTNFFTGLNSIQSNFGGGNINSIEFMQELNTLAGVDVTDFFNDWFFQPGYAHYSISNYTSTQVGSDYELLITVNQKLKGAADYHNNARIELTFMDAAWNKYTEDVVVSGDWEAVTVTVPFNPVFMAVNMNEFLNDATTAENDTITSVGNKYYNYANLKLTVSSLTDSAMFRVEHNWVSPDINNVPDNIQISRDRYWHIHGINMENIEGSMRFDFDGRNAVNSDFDNSITVSVGGQSFKEDSLVLLYRPNATSNWEVHPDFELFTQGNSTNKWGNIVANVVMPGQYAFGYRVHSVGIEENQTQFTYNIYPNPIVDTMNIDLSNSAKSPFSVDIFAINGQLMETRGLIGQQVNPVPMNHYKNGIYILVVRDISSTIIGTKRVVVSK